MKDKSLKNNKLPGGKTISGKSSKHISKKAKIIAVVLPCLAAAAILIVLLTGGNIAGAYVSLPYIETIVDRLESGGTFNILEIVDNEDDALFGYYISGQEPGKIGSWEQDIAGEPSSAARTAYVTDLRNGLPPGIMGDATAPGGAGEDDNPLTWIAPYEEQSPWLPRSSDMRALRLNHTETALNIPGEAVLVNDTEGEYTAELSFLPFVPGLTAPATDVLLVDELEPAGTSGGADRVYFPNVEFQEVELDPNNIFVYAVSAGSLAGQPVPGNFLLYYNGQNTDTQPFVIYEDYRDLGAYDDSDGPVFVVTDYGQASLSSTGSPIEYVMKTPVDLYSDSQFQSISDHSGFPAGALFTRTVTALHYVGAGFGNYNFNYDANSLNTVTMYHDIIFYEGGFVNNHWFLRHVFDREDNLVQLSRRLAVNVVETGSLTGDDISRADMIVLNGSIINIDRQRAVEIYNKSVRSGGFTPVMFDHTLTGKGGDIETLTRTLASKPADAVSVSEFSNLTGGAIPVSNGVNDNIFWTDRTVVELIDRYTEFENPDFGNPFRAVYLEIDYENFLRPEGVARIPAFISNATAVRYIINFAQSREPIMHEDIRVLELQGGIPDISINDRKDMIKEWIGDPDFPPERITVDQMTTYEFIGRLENLNETYHMIYIGGSAAGMNEENGESRYNDSSMNGLVYTNIGDRYRVNNDEGSGRALSGLVAGDNTDDRWFRLSGNDITPEKMEAIEKFAAAGYPVILDDRLVEKTAHPQRPASPCPACGSTTQWDNDSLPNWGGGEPGTWLQCNGRYDTPPTYPYCGLQFSPWTVGAMNNAANGNTPGIYEIPEDAFYYIENGINDYRVDNSSYMYEALGDIFDRPNVFSASAAASNFTLVGRYLNLSKPELTVNVKPREYEMINNDTLTGVMNCFDNNCGCDRGILPCRGISGQVNHFYFEIEIESTTDPTPRLTTYNVELFFDLNGDGRYSIDEKQTDIRVNNGSLQPVGDPVTGYYELLGNHSGERYIYTIEKQMPQEAVGLYDWCLIITQNGNTGIRASQKGYTRITPDPDNLEAIKTINILQIASDLVWGDIDNNTAPDSFAFKGAQQRVNFEWQQREITDYTQTVNLTRGILRDGTTVNPEHSSGETPEDGRAAYEYLRGKDGITYYEGIYGRLIADVDDFDINIYTMYAREVDSRDTLEAAINNRRLPSDGIPYIETKTGNYLVTCGLAEINPENNRYVISAGVDLDDIFQAFDMLIIGFDDSYGYLSGNAAQAVANFIEEKKATLFAHDAVTYYANRSGVDAYGMEASFILRNATNLDRYGLTNENLFPARPYSGNSLGALGVDQIIDDIINAGYAVGWTPKSGRTSTVPEIQGYNSHVLKWYNYGNRDINYTSPTPPSTPVVPWGDGTSGNPFRTLMNRTFGEIWWDPSGLSHVTTGTGRRTTQITQLNEGKITTYPYNVNIEDGNLYSQGGNLPIGTDLSRGITHVGGTHGQWHTVNMSKEDIVVWYCLDSNYYIRNDAANSYYIYNSGNVTYTGAGHSMTQGNTTGRNTSLNSTHPFRNGRTNQFNTFRSVATTWESARAEGSSAAAPNGWLLTPAIEYEAKLFVNTMIAAYRTANENPSITITDGRGIPLGGKINDTEYRFAYSLLPADMDVLSTGRIDDENRIVHFYITDGNLATPKYIWLNASFVGEYDPLPEPLKPFEDDDGNIINPITYNNLPVYIRGAEGIPANNRNGQLQSGIPYWFRLPEEVVAILNSTDASGNYRPVTMRLEAVTDFPKRNRDLKGYADLVIRRIELFNLS